MHTSLSSRNSYSGDYLRKKSLFQSEQPAMLTDRNAYVNFLEVQLERVSAACLGVQAYDQKFTDMQTMIVGLEQRCSSTTRLVALSQQCTEELRSNVFAEIEKLSNRNNSQHIEVQRSITILNNKIASLEENFNKVLDLSRKVNNIERDVGKVAIATENMDEQTKKAFKDVDMKLEPMQSTLTDACNSITSLQSSVSRQGVDVMELERRQSNAMVTMEGKFSDMLTIDRDENTRRLQNFSSKINHEFESVENDISSREVKVLKAFKTDLKLAYEDMQTT